MIRPVITTVLAVLAVAAALVAFTLSLVILGAASPVLELGIGLIGVATIVLGVVIVWQVLAHISGGIGWPNALAPSAFLRRGALRSMEVPGC